MARSRATPGRITPTDSVISTLRAAGCVFAEDEARLLAAQAASAEHLEAMVARRVTGLPLEHILGWVEFCGLRLDVDPGVFVPRRRTEVVVSEAVVGLRPGDVLVDLCCGSGAIGVAIATVVERVRLFATEIDAAAVRCARRNVEPLGGAVLEGDLYQPLPTGLRSRVAAIVMCAPYVPTDAVALMPPEARLHEPRVALDGGADGLDVVRRAVGEATSWLSPGGRLLVEVGRDQGAAAGAACAGAGLAPSMVTSEELGGTVVVGTMPGPR
jgi:release factor glutamine methyltransferase